MGKGSSQGLPSMGGGYGRRSSGAGGWHDRQLANGIGTTQPPPTGTTVGQVNGATRPLPTIDPNAGTGGGSPFEPQMSSGGDNFGAASPSPAGQMLSGMGSNLDSANALSRSLAMWQPPGGDLPKMMDTGGGGDPNAPQPLPTYNPGPTNTPDGQLGPPTGLAPNSGLMQMSQIPAGSAPAAYGGGGTNWQDRPIGPMRQGPGIPQGWTPDPNASGNPYWRPILNSRGSWWNERG